MPHLGWTNSKFCFLAFEFGCTFMLSAHKQEIALMLPQTSLNSSLCLCFPVVFSVLVVSCSGVAMLAS